MTGYTPTDATPDGVDHTDIDPQTGQSFGNREPDDPADPPADPGKRAASPEDKAKAKKTEVTPQRMPDGRADIYTKARESRASAPGNATNTGEIPDVATQMMQRRMEFESAGMGEEEQRRLLEEEFGTEGNEYAREVLMLSDPDAEPEPAAGSEPAKKPASQSADTWVKLDVNGQEQWATLAEAEEAGGVDQLQKRRANEMDRESLALERAALAREREELNERFSHLEETVESLRQPPASSSDGPSGKQLQQELDRLIEERTDAFLSGDRDEALRLDREVEAKRLDILRSERQAEPASQPAPGATPAPSPQPQPRSQLTPDQIAANQYFKDHFGDLAQNEGAMPRIRQRIAYLQTLDSNKGKPLTEIVKDAGEYVRREQGRPPEGASILGTEEVRKRIAMKRRSPGPSGASRAASSQQPGTRPMTDAEKRHEAVKQQQIARGQLR